MDSNNTEEPLIDKEEPNDKERESKKTEYTQAFFQKFLERYNNKSSANHQDDFLPDQDDALFDAQVFWYEIEKYILSRRCKSSSVAFLFVQNYRQSANSGWFSTHYSFNASDSLIDLKCLHRALKSAEITAKVYSALLSRGLIPKEDDLHLAIKHLEDKDFETFEAVLISLKKQQNLQFDQQLVTLLISETNKPHFGGIYCSLLLESDKEIVDIVLNSKMNKKGVKKFICHLKQATKIALLKSIINQAGRHVWLFKLVYKTVKSDSFDFLSDLIETKPSFFWENFEILNIIDDKSTNCCALNKIGILLVKAIVDESECLNESKIHCLIDLLKRGANLNILQYAEYDTPVHAAAMLSLKAQSNCALLQYVLGKYRFPEILNESPHQSVLKSYGSTDVSVSAVCNCLTKCRKIDPFLKDCNQNYKITTDDETMQELMRQAEEAWQPTTNTTQMDSSADITSNTCKSSSSEHSTSSVLDAQKTQSEEISSSNSFVKDIGELLEVIKGEDFDNLFSAEAKNETELQTDDTSSNSEKNYSSQIVEQNQDKELLDENDETESGTLKDDVVLSSDDDADDDDDTKSIHDDGEAEAADDDENCRFDDLLWEILISKQASDFLKAKKIPKDIVKIIKQKLYQIASGDRTHSVIRKTLQPEDKLYETKVLKSARILWQESIEYSEKRKCYMDVVKVLWITLRHNKSQLNDRIQQVKQALCKSRTCNSKDLKITYNPPQKDNSKRLPRKFRLSTEPNETNKCCPTPNLFDGEFSVMQFYPFGEFLKVLLSDNPSARDCPIQMSEEEHNIIKLLNDQPILLCGRSGTGKTTTCLYRLWNRFITAPVERMHDSKKDIVGKGQNHDAFHNFHQIFLAKSPVLCSKLKDQFDKLLAGRCAMPDFPKAKFDRKLNMKKIHRLNEIYDEQFPIPVFLTSRQFFILLDASLDASKGSFFPRNGRGELMVKIINSEYDENTDCNALFEDIEREIKLTHSANPDITEEWIEITADYFCNHIWSTPDFRKYHKDLDPLIVWIEIQSFIKGSVDALKSESGFLSFDQYNELPKKQAPMYYGDANMKSLIYNKCFKKYQEFLKQNKTSPDVPHYFDQNDFIFHVYHRLLAYKKELTTTPNHKVDWYFSSFYIDEIQDFTQSEICTILACSENPQETFCTGDVAQSIMKGVHFRFTDLKNQFWKMATMCKNKKKTPVELKFLLQNYRSHSGILNLGQSILEVLRNKEFFSFSCLDKKLSQENAVFAGPRPILLDTTSPEELVHLMLGSGHGETMTVHELGASQAIIVRSQEEKESLPASIKDGIVLTVLESKGLEFDDVLLYNFFSGIKDEVIPWNLLYNALDSHAVDSDLETDNERRRQWTFDILSIKGPHLFHRTSDNEKRLKGFASELKHLYTAITRAKKNLWIYEEDVELRRPVFYYWLMKDLAKFVKLDSLSDNDLIFAASSEKEQWEKLGDLLLKRKNWEEAVKCFEKAQKNHLYDLAKGYMLLEKIKKIKTQEGISASSQNTTKIMRGMYTEAALHLLKSGKESHKMLYFRQGSMCLIKAGLHEEAARAFESLKEYPVAKKEWLEAEKYEDVARIEERLGNFSNAIRYLLQVHQYEKALEKALEYEKNGKTLDLDVSSQQVANQIFKFKQSHGETEENLKNIALYIQDGVVKAAFLQQIGLYELAVDALVKENRLPDAYTLIKQKGMFSKGIKICESDISHREEFQYLKFIQMCQQSIVDAENHVSDIECLTCHTMIVNFSFAVAKFSTVVETKEQICLKILKINPNKIAQLNLQRILLDINHDDHGWKKYFELAMEAYEMAKIFEKDASLISAHLIHAREFYSLDVFDDDSFSMPRVIMDFFGLDAYIDLQGESKDDLIIIKKDVIIIALKLHFLTLSKEFLESKAVVSHLETVRSYIQSAIFYRDLCNQSANMLNCIRYVSDKFLNNVTTLIKYWELSQCDPDQLMKKAIVNLFAPCAAFHGRIDFSFLRRMPIVAKFLIKVAEEMIYNDTASLDEFYLAWRIVHTIHGSAKAKELITAAMNNGTGYMIITYNEKTIHMFNGWIVSDRQLNEGKVSKSIWSMYNYILTRVAQINNDGRTNALSVQSITYTVSVLAVSLMLMITIATFNPQFFIPSCFVKIMENHDAVHYDRHNSTILMLSFHQVMSEKLNLPAFVNRSFTQLKILLKFLTGQDKNAYNVLRQALSSQVSIEDGSALLCINLCLILVTNLFVNCKDDRNELQKILFEIHETVHECTKYGRKHFTNVAYEDLKMARKTNDLFSLVLKLFGTGTNLQKICIYSYGEIQFKDIGTKLLPAIPIKSLVTIKKPTTSTDQKPQARLQNPPNSNDDKIDVESATQQLINDIETNSTQILPKKEMFCYVCGHEIKEENHLELECHKKAQQNLTEFNEQKEKCEKSIQKLISEMEALQKYTEVESLIIKCQHELQGIEKIGAITRNYYSWGDGKLKLKNAFETIEHLKRSYIDLEKQDAELLKSKQEAKNENIITNTADVDILPDEIASKPALKKQKRKIQTEV